jgi:hypothetical protein
MALLNKVILKKFIWQDQIQVTFDHLFNIKTLIRNLKTGFFH